MELFDISIIVLLAPPLMKATSRHCIYILVYCIIKLQNTKFNLTLILFAPTDCFACLGWSGPVRNLKAKYMKKNTG